MSSSVIIQVPSYGYTYTFSGIISIQHEFTLKILTEAESASGTDYVNGARNKPDKIILTVVETDVGKLTGWADRMLQSMESIKQTRTLCNVVTSAKTYFSMRLSEFVATEDESSQCGWKGTLVFTESDQSAGKDTSGTKTNNNASTRKNTGTTAAKKLTESAFLQLLQRAGIR